MPSENKRSSDGLEGNRDRCVPSSIDFLTKCMVNVPDEKIRANRLTLLHNLLTNFSTIADFSEIVTSGDQK